MFSRRLFLLLGLISTIVALDATAANQEVPSAPSVTTDYILQPSDLVRVQVFQEPDLLREIRITQENSITLPLIGTVDLKNKTVHQAEEKIRDLYNKDYLVNPQINITVLEYTLRFVKVLGAVNQPGVITFPPEQPMGLLDAIAKAGGFTRLANRKQVRLSRTLDDGKTETYTINTDELINGSSNDAWILSKGDVVYVSERIF